jgi:hypothetical protein
LETSPQVPSGMIWAVEPLSYYSPRFCCFELFTFLKSRSRNCLCSTLSPLCLRHMGAFANSLQPEVLQAEKGM